MKRILLLDDNPDSLEVAESVLKYENYDVKTADKCTGFMQLAEQYLPHLMILDYRLGDGNGGDLCREIKTNVQLNHIPIMLFSADSKARLELLDYDCDAVISKPFDLIHFLTTVKKLTDNA